jgi:hypothetical protein
MKSPFAVVAESESTGTGLAIPLGDPKQVFKLGGSLPFVKAVEEHVATLKPMLDISTKEGRAFIASTAFKIARTKTYAFAKAKEISAVYKAMAKEVDDEANQMSKSLDRLKHDTRRPLTEWEERDLKRNAEFETKIGEIFDACLFVGTPTVEAIQARMAKLRAYESDQWFEFADRAHAALKESIPALAALLTRAEREAADRAELEELRAFKSKQPPSAYQTGGTTGRETLGGELIPPQAAEAVNVHMKQTAPMPQITKELLEDSSRVPRLVDFYANDADDDILNDLMQIVDIDQAADIIAAIKAGKIRHVQIVY